MSIQDILQNNLEFVNKSVSLIQLLEDKINNLEEYKKQKENERKEYLEYRKIIQKKSYLKHKEKRKQESREYYLKKIGGVKKNKNKKVMTEEERKKHRREQKKKSYYKRKKERELEKENCLVEK